MSHVVLAITLASIACGGSRNPAAQGETNLGRTLTQADDTTIPMRADGSSVGSADAGPANAFALDAGLSEPNAPVTIEIVNSHEQELTFSLNKGWQANVNAIRADKKSFFLMYPKHCTASCDIDEQQRCPLCVEHETTRAEREAQQRQVIAPGEMFALPWNGRAYQYERTQGKQGDSEVGCECYRETEPPSGAFEISICGKRETTEVGVRSKLQCVKVPIMLPLGAEPIRLRAEFPKPPVPKKKRRR